MQFPFLFAQHERTLTGESPKYDLVEVSTAKSKGVHGDVESERSSRQNSGLTNRNHIEATYKDKTAKEVKIR